ncbi:MAG TPA: caspase family protein [Mucilaginibacter sp.]|jgi:hypothetical protein|nr:caspase family protein [Mucilaginibacter sp.]
MNRRALIIYCNNTYSGALPGPEQDNKNYRRFLKSYLGGEWYEDEIKSLNNPTSILVEQMRQVFLNGADYTFIIFTGHGFINSSDNNYQYIELSDKNVSMRKLVTDAKRQTIIFDACRGLETFESDEIIKSIKEDIKMFSAGRSTRAHFDKAVQAAEEGLTTLFAASVGQSAQDSKDGALYLLSLIRVSESWAEEEANISTVLPLHSAHKKAVKYMDENFISLQEPIMGAEKRKNYFPFAIKLRRQIFFT